MSVRNVPYLPPTPHTPNDYRTFRVGVINYRAKVDRECTDDRMAQAREIVRCADDPAYFMAVYGTIYEARPKESEDERAGAGFIPFVPFPFQIEAIDWFDQRMESRGRGADGVVVKSRDMGLSNIAVFWLAHHWLFHEPFQARLLSRKEDLVDAKGDPDSLMWKLDTFLKGLPTWLLQAGAGPDFSWRKHRTKLRLRNPRNGNAISGESTQSNAGRGGRASVVILDEAAFMPGFGQIWTGLRASTNHRIAISTVSLDEGHDFYNLHHGKEGYDQPSVLEIPWNLHPYHDEAWLKDQMSRDTIEGIRREVFMDYFSGGGEWVYPESHTKETGEYDYQPYAGPLFVALDDGWDDEWAVHLIQYNLATGRHRLIDSVFGKHKHADYWGSVLTGIPRSDFTYDDNALHFMRLMRQLPGVTFVGDTHVSNRNNINGQNLFEYMSKQFNIHIFYDFTQRQHPDRRLKLGRLINMFDFNDTPGGEYTLEALKRNRFKTKKQGHQDSTESRQPVHDWTSHPTTALEWYAVNFETFQHTISGKSVKYSGRDNE